MTPKQFLQTQTYFTLAVLHDGRPWATTLAIKHYEDGVLTWFSKLDTIHSQAIQNTPTVAFSAYVADDEHGKKFGISAYATTQLVEELPGGVGRYEATITHLDYITEFFVKQTAALDEL